jgi:hypothetical protein
VATPSLTEKSKCCQSSVIPALARYRLIRGVFTPSLS